MLGVELHQPLGASVIQSKSEIQQSNVGAPIGDYWPTIISPLNVWWPDFCWLKFNNDKQYRLTKNNVFRSNGDVAGGGSFHTFQHESCNQLEHASHVGLGRENVIVCACVCARNRSTVGWRDLQTSPKQIGSYHLRAQHMVMECKM